MQIQTILNNEKQFDAKKHWQRKGDGIPITQYPNSVPEN